MLRPLTDELLDLTAEAKGSTRAFFAQSLSCCCCCCCSVRTVV